MPNRNFMNALTHNTSNKSSAIVTNSDSDKNTDMGQDMQDKLAQINSLSFDDDDDNDNGGDNKINASPFEDLETSESVNVTEEKISVPSPPSKEKKTISPPTSHMKKFVTDGFIQSNTQKENNKSIFPTMGEKPQFINNNQTQTTTHATKSPLPLYNYDAKDEIPQGVDQFTQFLISYVCFKSMEELKKNFTSEKVTPKYFETLISNYLDNKLNPDQRAFLKIVVNEMIEKKVEIEYFGVKSNYILSYIESTL